MNSEKQTKIQTKILHTRHNYLVSYNYLRAILECKITCEATNVTVNCHVAIPQTFMNQKKSLTEQKHNGVLPKGVLLYWNPPKISEEWDDCI